MAHRRTDTVTHRLAITATLAVAASGATTRPALPRLDFNSVGMNGSMRISVTSDGTLTQTTYSRERGERSGTRQLTARQMADLTDVVTACLQRPSALERAMDIRIIHQIGDQTFDEDGTNSRFDDLNATLSRLAKPVKHHPIPATR